MKATLMALGAGLLAALACWAAPGLWRHVRRERQWRAVRREVRRDASRRSAAEPYEAPSDWGEWGIG